MNTSLPPELKRFVDKKLKEGHYLSADDLVVDALRRYKEWDYLRSQHKTNLFQQARELVDANYSSLGDTGMGGDIQAVAFLVLMEAAKGAREDLKNIMAHLKTINTARQNLREMITKVNKDIAANIGQNNGKAPLDFSNGFGNQQAYHRVRMPYAEVGSDGRPKFVRTDLYPGRIINVEQLRSIRDDLKDRLDGLGEMSEMESLRLQMAMDRMSKMMSTLSNMLKKLSDVQNSINQNIK